MNVKFTVDYDLIELVDAIGLDYDIVNAKSDVIDNYKEIEILLDEVEYHVENEEELLSIMNNEELCEFLLHPELKDGVIRIK